MKKCSRCKIEKPLTDFCIRQKYCKECQSLWHKTDWQKDKKKYTDRSRKRRSNWREWLYTIKANMKCKDCGNDNIIVLDFHHRNRSEKSFLISEFVSRVSFNEKYKQIVLDEIKKCDILCANCHRIEEWKYKENNGM